MISISIATLNKAFAQTKTALTLQVERINRIRFHAASLLAIILLFSQVSVAQNWVLKWQDNFESGLLDATNTWNVEIVTI